MKPLTLDRIKALLTRWFGWFRSELAPAPTLHQADPVPVG